MGKKRRLSLESWLNRSYERRWKIGAVNGKIFTGQRDRA